ncbi:MAG TPA: isoaspartyl peptidase/L-asparaginase [Prolixibacteraceae bacterium]|nr:isoaspartyl peptidase/L-asparaginase [Prolixibacteraceae bacterium]
MKYCRFLSGLSLCLILIQAASLVTGQQNYCLVIHGGAGIMDPGSIPPEKQAAYAYHLNKALTIGDSVLKQGGTSAEAVVRTISYLEDCPLFNAGKGAVFNWEGKNELDASVMEGASLKAGAVSGVKTIKNPIKAAVAVMNNSEHVFLSGKGAEEFARKQGLEIVPNRYFYTKNRYESLKKLKERERNRNQGDNHGTVGCVALDKMGNLCAGTSTGGMTGKRYGRIGDTPVIGAGTYADNATCAVSCTGHGEYFIRLGVARDVALQMDYLGLPLEKAAANVMKKLGALGGTGGFIALDRKGNLTMPFNTSGMFRGYIKSTGEKEIAIFATDK